MLIKDFSGNTFKYSNKKFMLIIQLFSNYNNESLDKLVLDDNMIESFEYTNQFNNLCLTGKIVYTDCYSLCSRFFESQYVTCQVLFEQLETKQDSDIIIENPISDQIFSHLFIVNNISILDRQHDKIKYQFDLISYNWFNLTSNVLFSNYGKEKQSIFDIIKICYTNNGLKVNEDIFKKIKTKLKLNYISNNNDNCFTITKYLLNRMYYFNDSLDESLKFIFYDDQNDEYRIFDQADKETIVGIHSTIISFFKSNIEGFIVKDPNEIGTISTLPKTTSYSNFFSHNISDYSYKNNLFSINTISSINIMDFLNKNAQDDKLIKKYWPMKFGKYSFNNDSTYWNNNIQIYVDAIQTTIEDNSLVLNTVGTISIKPGYYINIAIDRNNNFVGISDLEKKAENDEKFKTFEGIWTISRVRHLIDPINQIYRQNLVLYRNNISEKIHK